MKKINLFQAGKDWQNNACINIGRSQHYAYSLGYKETADFLASSASEVSAQDLFIYPIAFLYRHHLELQLKLIIETGNQLLDRKDTLLHDLHNLDKLWATAKEIVLKVWPQANTDHLKPIDYVIIEYQKIDPKSTTFRYSKDIGSKSHLQGIKHINISFLSDTVNKAASILDNIYDGLMDFIDAKGEMMSYAE